MFGRCNFLFKWALCTGHVSFLLDILCLYKLEDVIFVGGKISTDHPKSAAFTDRKCLMKLAKELTVMRCLLRIITIINSIRIRSKLTK